MLRYCCQERSLAINAESVCLDVEQMYGRHTRKTGIAIAEHLLTDGYNLTENQRADIRYLLETFKQLKISQTADERAHKNISVARLDKSTQNYLLNFCKVKQAESVALRKVKRAVGVIRCQHRLSGGLRKLVDSDDQMTQLEKLDSWSEFNIFDFAKTTPCPLRCIAFDALDSRGLFQTFGCDTEKAHAFLTRVENMYIKSNPYHNNLHAADVTQGVHSIMRHESVKKALAEIEIFALILAASGHDVAHPGFTNDYMVNSRHALAVTYNDNSVNENMHCAEFFSLLHRNEYNFLECLSQPQQVAVRKDIIHAILGTDMKYHFSHHKKFNELIETKGADVTKWDDMQPLQQATLHAADIGNPTRALTVALEWTDRVLTEFFHQGDVELDAGLPVSPLCDKHTTSKPGSQVGFVNFIVGPTYETFFKIDPEMIEQLGNVDIFKKHWATELAKPNECDEDQTID